MERLTTNSMITTDNADEIACHAAHTGQLPPMYNDALTQRIVADIPIESRYAFLGDAPLQRYLSAKKAVWRAISDLRNKGARHD